MESNDETTTNNNNNNNNNNNMKQQLASEKDKLKQQILETLTELYFLRNDGLMCDFHLWSAKEQHTSHIANTKDEDLVSERQFSHLLNLKLDSTSTSTPSSSSAELPTPPTTGSSHEPLGQPSTTTDDKSIIAPPPEKRIRRETSKDESDKDTTSHSHPPSDTTSIPAGSSVNDTPASTQPTASLSTPTKETDSRLNEPAESNLSERVVDESDKNDCNQLTSTHSKTESPTQTSEVVNTSVSNSAQEHLSTTTTTTITTITTTLSETENKSSIIPPPEKRICRETGQDEAQRGVTSQLHTASSTTEPLATIINDTPTSTQPQTFSATPTKEIDSRLNESVESNFSHHVVDKSDKNDCNQLTSTPAKVESPTRISKVVDPIVSNSATSLENHNKQLFERAKHEALVTARIAELRKLGLWSAKRLPKLQEPPRPKTHWDYVLEEMRWLSADFDAERKWKRKAAKKCALMVYRYHQDIRLKTERAEREQLQHIKKLAALAAREVKSFWITIEKIVDFRQQTKLEETRKKAWGQHLNYILDQTSKFSNNCPENNPVIAPSDIKVETKDMEIDYMISQDGENAEKDAVIKKQKNDEQAKSKHEVDDIAAGAESIQPKGNTLETTTVSTKIPFLLKHNLREYQHIGLDWLVAMYNKKLNGILADEMGLGKTIQTIALLAHLACEKNDWGPHLIVVPTSVMLNWEMEFKKWCPGFKILTYFGNPKERRMKRVGWSLPNSFHVCITSYRIVIQDHAAFRRKKWCYFILDEAHYIKNFKSQRWQMLLNFNSQRRLLLTGTPLQNDLMELWSLMHFLMPNLFDSYREFKDWFVNPLTGMIEGSHEYNQELVQRLHKILRPFLLRRLKADVEKQLPSKREFIKSCKLSKRQRFLYEEFMSLSKTKETLATGNFLSVINILMQLRKVCNHPNLFEPRPTISPFMMNGIVYKIPGTLSTPLDYNPYKNVNISSLHLNLALSSQSMTSFAHEFLKKNYVPKEKLVQELDNDEDKQLIKETDEDMEPVDETIELTKSPKIAEAHNKLKLAQQADKKSHLQFVSSLSEERCTKVNPCYYTEIQDLLYLNSLNQVAKSSSSNSFSNGTGRIICSHIELLRSNRSAKLELLTKLVDEAIKTPVQRVENMYGIIDRFVFCVPGVSAQPIGMHASHYSPAKKCQEVILQQTLYEHLAPRFNFLSKIMVNMRTSFPELRLIEYDCGKLQTLGRLLNELKSQDHRVLIFTQMSRMLDILEQFLNYHGHTYLRLDGATKIDQRQILMERFNNDRKIFCFILSTRSGGIGVNLTGADTVIFYDSDWNPTMDAQAQDRCHRIGQTRDVHIYRLISEDTIERNIFMKAQQKRMLGDLAIEEGNFNTSCFKRHAIQELFNLEPSNAPVEVDKVVDVNGKSTELSNTELIKLEQALSRGEVEAGEDMDVDAIKVARADVDTDLREFDENIPLTEVNSPVEKSEKEQQIDTMVSQMTKVEQYAVRFLESLQKPKNKEELEQAEKEYQQELENKKSQWEQSRMEMLKEQSIQNDQPPETLLTYPKDAKCQHVQYLLDGEKKVEEMPLWAPPTPPTSPPSPVEDNNQYHYQPAMTPAMAARINAMGGLDNIFGFGSGSDKKDDRHFIDEKDLYHDYTVHFLYEPNIMLESQLPPVNQQYSESEFTSYTIGSKKIRLTGTSVVPSGYFPSTSQLPHLQQHLQNSSSIPSTPDGSSSVMGQSSTRKPKVRRDEVICLPKSIFDRQTPNFAKIRRELKLQKLRCVTKGNDSDPFAMQKFFHSFSMNPLGQSLQQETIVNSVNRQLQQFNNPAILLPYHQTQLPAWTIQEEWALLMVIQHLQDLPVNLCILTPGHTPNWELVSEVITDIGFTHRSFKMCEYHFALNVQKREMTRDSNWDERAMQSNPSLDSSSQPQQQQQVVKKQKKLKNQMLPTAEGQQPSQQLASTGPTNTTATTTGSTTTTTTTTTSSSSSATNKGVPAPTTPFKPSKTGSMLVHDKSLQISFGERYDIIKRIRQSRPKPMRARYNSRERPPSQPTNLLRDDKKIIDYDRPLKPETLVMELIEERKRRAIARGVYSCCNPRDRSICYNLSQTPHTQNGTPPTSCKHK